MLKITQFKWKTPDRGRNPQGWEPVRYYIVKDEKELHTLFTAMLCPFAIFKDNEEFFKYKKMTFKTEADRYNYYFQRYNEWINAIIYDFNMSCERMLPEYDCFDWTRPLNHAPNNYLKLIVEVV